MAQRAADPTKYYALAVLNKGDKVKLTDGSIAEFVKLKQKNFDGLIDGKPYNIPVNMFVEVVEKTDLKEKVNKIDEELTTLKKGDFFYIDKSGSALLFKYEGMEKGRIVGINPIGNMRTRIDKRMYVGKVADI